MVLGQCGRVPASWKRVQTRQGCEKVLVDVASLYTPSKPGAKRLPLHVDTGCAR